MTHNTDKIIFLRGWRGV